MNIKPFWEGAERPNFLFRTETLFSRAKITTVLNDRGLENRLLENLLDYLPSGAYIAGGFLTSVIQGDDKATDIDIFFNGPKAFQAIYEMLQDPEDGAWGYEGYTLETKCNFSYDGDGEKGLRFVKFSHETRPPIQLIKLAWYNSPEHVIDSFDLTVAQFATDGTDLIFNPISFLDIARKRIVLHRMQFPASTLRRIIKYAHKGYYACPGSLATIARAVTETMQLYGDETGKIVYVD